MPRSPRSAASPASSAPAILMCNPYYQAYIGAALAAGAEPVFLNATRRNRASAGPRRDRRRRGAAVATVAFYLCSPANPQGAVASEAYIRRALDSARAHDFMLFFDECYSELYSGAAPTGGLDVAAKTPERFRNLVVFNSLSKRSNLPGLRSGFSAGDAPSSRRCSRSATGGPQMPGPTQHASAAVWAEEQHVTANRLAYGRKYDVADRGSGHRFGYRRPAGGFFLWLNMSQIGDGSHAAITLWKRFGVKVLPGAFLSQTGRDGTNPGARLRARRIGSGRPDDQGGSRTNR